MAEMKVPAKANVRMVPMLRKKFACENQHCTICSQFPADIPDVVRNPKPEL